MQDNGNWSLLRHTKRRFPVHVYGRCLEESRQRAGQALYSPDPDDGYYDLNEPLDQGDLEETVGRLETNLSELLALPSNVPFSAGRLRPSY